MTEEAQPALASRLEALESRLAIGQLVARYAYAIDGRDIDGLVALFAPDVDCGRWGVGRDALGAYYRPTLARFRRSIHLISGHVIELGSDGHATGVTYCRAEHEYGAEWIIQTFVYYDAYELIDGEWYFRRRRLATWYANDVTERPAGPEFVRWQYVPRGRLPDDMPHWAAFWAAADADSAQP
jgi:hypothetical protein